METLETLKLLQGMNEVRKAVQESHRFHDSCEKGLEFSICNTQHLGIDSLKYFTLRQVISHLMTNPLIRYFHISIARFILRQPLT